MLSASDNELMCRVGPGTVMGDLVRQYWIPALSPSELPTVDGPPIRLRLLGENLIAFRVSSGKIGLIQNACPHRGASMFFGRNEEEGLRCVYHGWKFDVEGACVDMPSEPAESNFKNKVRTVSYPTLERNGIIWAYMGPNQTPPALPDLLPNLQEGCFTQKFVEECNFMQALEGDIDTVHWGFLHAGHVRPDDCVPNSPDFFATKHRNMESVTFEHEIGTTYGAIRPADETHDNWRMGNYMLPFYTQAANGVLGVRGSMRAWVPLDDEHTMVWTIGSVQTTDKNVTGIGGLRQSTGRNDPGGRFGSAGGGGRGQNQLPETTDWLGRYRSALNLGNDYRIDRDLQSAIEMDPAKPQTGTYTGIVGGAQDPMAQESMGPIYDRTQEHLGTTDVMIIRTRQKLLGAAKALRARGEVPPGVENPRLYRMLSGGAIVPKGQRGIEAGKHILFQGEQMAAIEVPTGGGA